MLAAIGLPGFPELFILSFIFVKLIVILFLAGIVLRKFPTLMRQLGRGIGAFQRGVDEGRRGQ